MEGAGGGCWREEVAQWGETAAGREGGGAGGEGGGLPVEGGARERSDVVEKIAGCEEGRDGPAPPDGTRSRAACRLWAPALRGDWDASGLGPV